MSLLRRLQRPVTSRPRRRRRLHDERLEERIAFSVSSNLEFIPVDTIYDGVVHIELRMTNGEFGACSGALLEDGRTILTAAHCVTPDGSATLDVSSVAVTFDLVGKDVVFEVSANEIFVHPLWNGDAAYGNDIAVLRLPAMAPSGPGYADRYLINRDIVETGKRFDFVGYGKYSTDAERGIDPPDDPDAPTGRKTRIRNTVDHLGGYSGLRVVDHHGQTSLHFDHDSGRQQNNQMDVIVDSSAAKISGEGMFAKGDSGGPAFIDGKIAGVASRVWSAGIGQHLPFGYDSNVGANSSYGDVGVMEQVRGQQAFIDGFIRAPRSLIVDMNYQVEGDDGLPDTIEFRYRKLSFSKPSAVLVFINGRLADEVPLSRLHGEIEFIGSNDAETIVVASEITSLLTVQGGGGHDRLKVRATGNAALNVSDSSISANYAGTSTLVLIHSDIQEIAIDGKSGNTVNLGSSRPDVPVTINDVGAATIGGGDLTAIGGPVYIYNASGSARLTVDGSTSPNGNQFEITQTGLPNQRIYYDAPNISELTLRTGLGTDWVEMLAATAPAKVNVFDAGGNIDRVTFDGERDLVANRRFELDAGKFQQQEMTFTGDRFVWRTVSALTFSGIETATVLGADERGNTFNIRQGTLGTTTRVVGGAGADVYNVYATGLFAPFQLFAGEGDDVFRFGGGSSILWDTVGGVYIDGGQGYDAATFEDLGSRYANIGRDLTVTQERISSQMQNSAFASTYDYLNLESIALYGRAPSTYRIESTAPNSHTTIRGGDKTDTFLVGPNLDNLLGTLELSGGAGVNRLSISDDASPGDRSYHFAAGHLRRYGLAATPEGYIEDLSWPVEVSFEGFTSLDFVSASGAYNAISLASTSTDSVLLRGNPSAEDVFSVLANDHIFQSSAIRVRGNGQTDRALFLDTENFHRNYRFAAEPGDLSDPNNAEEMVVQRDEMPAVRFSELATLVAALADRENADDDDPGSAVAVESTLQSMRLEIAAGDKTQITVGRPIAATQRRLDLILGDLAVRSYDRYDSIRLLLDDSANPSLAPRTISIDPAPGNEDFGKIAGLSPADISWRFTGQSQIELRGSAADESFELTGELIDVVLSIFGGGGEDVIP